MKNIIAHLGFFLRSHHILASDFFFAFEGSWRNVCTSPQLKLQKKEEEEEAETCFALSRCSSGEGMALTFKAFLAASASDRLSKLTNPTGWGEKEDRTKRKKHCLGQKSESAFLSEWQKHVLFLYTVYIFSFLIRVNSFLLRLFLSCPVYETVVTWGEIEKKGE